MKVSLVLATLNRVDEVGNFLHFLDLQTYRDFELIVVDQNAHDALVPLIDQYRNRYKITHLRTDIPGLSRARNFGLAHVGGDIVGFPDDDCWYDHNTLSYVVDYLRQHPDVDGLTGRFTNERGESEGRWLKRSARINKYNVWKAAISFSIFIRREVIVETGYFNESLGLGAGTEWCAGEETEYLLRCLKRGFRLQYRPDLILKHPVKTTTYDAGARARQRKYEAGKTRVIRISDYPFWYFPSVCVRTTLGAAIAALSCNWPKARFKFAILTTRLKAWRQLTEV